MHRKLILRRIGDHGYRINIDGRVAETGDKKDVRGALEHFFGGHTRPELNCPVCRKIQIRTIKKDGKEWSYICKAHAQAYKIPKHQLEKPPCPNCGTTGRFSDRDTGKTVCALCGLVQETSCMVKGCLDQANYYINLGLVEEE